MASRDDRFDAFIGWTWALSGQYQDLDLAHSSGVNQRKVSDVQKLRY